MSIRGRDGNLPLASRHLVAQVVQPQLRHRRWHADVEATALLTTWQRSYFASPGLRLFYLVPRVWTDHYLPLTISQPAHMNRVMIGRLELISDEPSDREAMVGTDREAPRSPPSDPDRQRILHGQHLAGPAAGRCPSAC